jgi:acetyl esterase/lipase
MSSRPVSRRRALGLAGALAVAVAGVTGAVRSFGSPAPRPRPLPGTERVVEAYGAGGRRTGEWWLPPGSGTAVLPTVVLVHGGYWRRGYDRSLEDAVAADLSGRGHLVWNIDYAASDQPWPSTLQDVAAGYDALASGRFAARVDPARVAVVGHSAGGHLALWLASRARVPHGEPGAVPPGAVPSGAAPTRAVPSGAPPRPALVVAQAPVASLVTASRLGLGGGAVDALLGGSPEQVPERYRAADPVALLPTRVRTVLVHGVADEVVPLSQSEEYVTTARAAGDDSSLVRVAGGHFVHLDPGSAALDALRAALAGLGGPAR